MSNPFDQFAVDVQAAMPGYTAPPATDPNNPFANGFGPPPSPAHAPATFDKPVMSAPPSMNGYGQPPMGQPQMGNGQPQMGNGQPQMGMGQQQQMGQSQMYGGMAPQMGQPQPGYGAPMTAAPPTPQRNAPMMGAPPTPGGGSRPGAPANDPFAAYGAPPQQQFDAPPTPGSAHPPFMAPPGAPPTPGGAAPPFMAPPVAPPTPQRSAAGGDPFAGYGAPPAAPTQAPPADPFAGYGAPAPAQPPAGGDPFASYGAPPQAAQPPAADPFAAYGAPPAQSPYGGGYGAPAPNQPQADPSAGALVLSQTQSNPYAQQLPPQQQQYGAPPQQQQYGAPPQQQQYGAPPQQQEYGAPQQQQYGAPQQQQYGAPAADPFGGGYGAPPPGQPGPPPPYGGDAYGAPPQAAVDPFSVFNSAPAPAPQPAPAPPQNQLVPAQGPPPQQASQQGNDDMWGDLGFAAPPNGQAPEPAPAPAGEKASAPDKRAGNGDLPPGGEFYDARIFTPTLGVMFFKPQELTDSLFLNADRSLVDALVERPVVAFIVEGSSARSAGVELGHVLLKVNGVDVRNPKEASRLIKEGPRPLPLLFYVPNTDVVVAEGEHMVKYDTRDTNTPNSAKDWKPKYVVIGGIIAQPWMMNMYRSKSEYDIAVIETQARRPVSVKVKQFSLQGSRIQNDWQGPQMVKYKNKLHPWKYIVVLPVARNPIKISSPNLASLKPVHEGVRRVLLAQQRSRGGNSRNAAPRPQSRAHQEAYSSQGNGQAQQGGGQQQQQQYRY
jgi:hypothetical protein